MSLSGSLPQRIIPGAAAGDDSWSDEVVPPGEPAVALGGDRGEVVVAEHAAEPVGDRDQQAAGDEDPRLRVRVAGPACDTAAAR